MHSVVLVDSVCDFDLWIYPCENYFRFTASDGKQKLKGILQSGFSSMVQSGAIQNMGLIRILEYTLNDIPGKPEK